METVRDRRELVLHAPPRSRRVSWRHSLGFPTVAAAHCREYLHRIGAAPAVRRVLPWTAPPGVVQVERRGVVDAFGHHARPPAA